MQASGEFSLEVAYLPMEDVIEKDTDDSSGVMRFWTNGVIDTVWQADTFRLRWRLFSSFCVHLSLVLLKLVVPPNGRK